MATPAARLFRKLDGLFAVYKPQGVHWKLVRDTVETNLLKAVNSCPSAAPRSRVHFQLLPSGDCSGSKQITVTKTSLPALADHPLVIGPKFHKIHVGVGHQLDAFSSGVLVLGLGNGNTALESLYRLHVTRVNIYISYGIDTVFPTHGLHYKGAFIKLLKPLQGRKEYTLEGELGTATDDFSHTGRVIERSTFDHVTVDKLERVLAMIQGANQKALITYSQVDLSTQEAYELAVKGLLRPQGKSPPILTGLRCLRFKPPQFTLEVQCVNETQKFLRKLVHEVGLELRTNATCTKVRRTRDGPFKMEDTLTRHHWTAEDIIPAIANFRRTTRKIRKNDIYRQHVKQSDSTTQTQGPTKTSTCQLESAKK